MKAVPTSDLLDRITRVRQSLAGQKFPAVVTLDPVNAYYLTGMICSNPLVLITPKIALFMTDFRYAESARADVTHMEVEIFPQHTLDKFVEKVKKLRLKTVAFEGGIPYDTWAKLTALSSNVRWVNAGAMFRQIRQIKSKAEIATIARNQGLNEKVFLEAKDFAAVGKSEYEIRAFIRHRMLDLNADEAFDSIIAAGKHSAEPHAHAGRAKVANGQYLLFDMGVKRDLYHSDMTRTMGVGKSISTRHKDIYEIVLTAQIAALEAIRPGARCADIDAVARNVIRDAGYGDFFGHGLGHGVGLQIHEGPTLNALSVDVLEKNMVITVEPGIYVPGFGGVRIEDLVVVTGSGHRNLTKCSKTFERI